MVIWLTYLPVKAQLITTMHRLNHFHGILKVRGKNASEHGIITA
jgi:hypothetical protein